jgi:hypothetical protein
MPNFKPILTQLKSAKNRVQQELERLGEAIRVIEGVSGGARQAGTRGVSRGPAGRRRLSAAARARIAAAQRARWAKAKRAAAPKSTRRMSQAARKKIAAAQRARWAKWKAQQQGQKVA